MKTIEERLEELEKINHQQSVVMLHYAEVIKSQNERLDTHFKLIRKLTDAVLELKNLVIVQMGQHVPDDTIVH